MRSKARLQADYDEIGASYDKVRFGTAGGRYADQVEKELLWSVFEGNNALEIGTATGRFAVFLTKIGIDYTGIDLSQTMLRVTAKRARSPTAKLSLLQMDAEHIGLRSSFDCVLCIRTFHFLPHPLQALRSMNSALRTGGRCLVTFETDNPLRRISLNFGRTRSEQRYYHRKEVVAIFGVCGFRVLESGAVLRLPVTLYRYAPKRIMFLLKRLDSLWPWSMHEYVLGEKK